MMNRKKFWGLIVGLFVFFIVVPIYFLLMHPEGITEGYIVAYLVILIMECLILVFGAIVGGALIYLICDTIDWLYDRGDYVRKT